MTQQGRLAVVLRAVQWELDDVAFALPRGVSAQRCRHVANGLVELAEALRSYAGGEVIELSASAEGGPVGASDPAPGEADAGPR